MPSLDPYRYSNHRVIELSAPTYNELMSKLLQAGVVMNEILLPSMDLVVKVGELYIRAQPGLTSPIQKPKALTGMSPLTLPKHDPINASQLVEELAGAEQLQKELDELDRIRRHGLVNWPNITTAIASTVPPVQEPLHSNDSIPCIRCGEDGQDLVCSECAQEIGSQGVENHINHYLEKINDGPKGEE